MKSSTLQPADDVAVAPVRQPAAVDEHAATSPLQRQQQLADTSPQAIQLQRQAQLMVSASSVAPTTIRVQRAATPNRTGMPDRLKSGIEALSGMRMDHVNVHYNSDKPAQLQAHAYAQGSDIHLAPGQEAHLPHEAWHVVQQAQGRVRPTLQMEAGAINDDPSLETEADTMGGKAVQLASDHVAREVVAAGRTSAQAPVQRVRFGNVDGELGPDKQLDALRMNTVIGLGGALNLPVDADGDAPMPMLEFDIGNGRKRFSVSEAERAAIGSADVVVAIKKARENPGLAPHFPLAQARMRFQTEAVRKANRVAGLLERKHAGAFAAIVALNGYVRDNTDPVAGIISVVHTTIPPTLQQLELNRLLLTALRAIVPGNTHVPQLQTLVDTQWRAIEGQTGDKVIAHRGDGATYDKMGGTLERDQHDHVYTHADENSAASTDKFLHSWRNPLSQLAGIECDIFLTADQVPIVTHTSNVHGLLAQEARQPRYTWTGPNINTIPAAELNPRFLPLTRWLNRIDEMVTIVAQQEVAHGQSPRKLRVEIEMKQADFSQNPAAWGSTNKVVSAFLKQSANSHRIEIAMFNNSAVPAAVNAAAATKSTLSHVTFGQGGTAQGAATLKEVRYGLHQRGLLAEVQSGALDGKVVTFAPGLDHPGVSRNQQPGAAPDQLLPVHALPTQVDVMVEQSIQSARFSLLGAALRARREQGHPGAASVHLLTDHGETGAATMKATQGLYVAGAPPLAQWDTRWILAKHPDMTDDALRAIVNGVLPAQIGMQLLTRFPTML